MRKVFLFLACTLLLGISCSEQSTEFTDEQKAVIEQEVEEQFREYVSVRNQLNFDLWSKFWDSEDFMSANALNFGALMSYNAWMDSVEISFERRDRHHSEVKEIETNALTSEIVVLTSAGVFENWWSGNYHKLNGCETQIWKKHPEGWKIIYVHESGWLIEGDLIN